MFSIPVKFKCKSCESTFEYVDQFIGHKKKKHFTEFKKLKCILFEEKADTTGTGTGTDGGGDGNGIKECVLKKRSSHVAKSSPGPAHEELITTDYTNTNIKSCNDAVIERKPHPQASSWNHQNLISFDSNETAESYSLSLLNPDNIIHEEDINETDPLADHGIKEESELEIEIELDADSESQFDHFLDDQSTSSGHEELAEINATPLSSVEIKYRAKHASLQSFASSTSSSVSVNENLSPEPYVLIRRLTSEEIERAGEGASSSLRSYIATPNREKLRQGVRKKVWRTNKIITSSHSNSNRSKPFPCDVCGASFYTNGNLSSHLATHSDLRAFKCKFPNCARAFKAKKHLDAHKFFHSDERPFKCTFPGCDKASKSREAFKSHLRIHKKEHPYKCSQPYCNKSFQVADSLEQHISTCHGQISEPPILDPAINGNGSNTSYICEFCSLEFQIKSLLNRHLATHSDIKPFKCSFPNCTSRFKLKKYLDQHELSHSNVRPYKCTHPGCSKATKYLHAFHLHLRTHTDDRPYKCQFENCDKTFRHPDSLKAHIVMYHMDNEEAQKLNIPVNYSCDLQDCNKKFYKKQSYLKHYKAHKKELDSLRKCPHPGCNSNFKRAELILHMRRVHNKGQKKPISVNHLPPHVILVQPAAALAPVSVSE